MSDDLDFGATIQGFAPGQKLSRRYSLNRTLGEGGMGVVWLVRDEELKRDIAMKFLPEMVVRDREAIAGLKRETNRSLELTHANIVRIYDFVQEGNWACISMEYVDGDTLSALKIDEPGGCFNVGQIEPWIDQLCQALSYAHEEAQVVHRDLKPTNLMLTKTGRLKITDFGISGTLSESMSRVSIRATSSGTLVYMSPQQAMGEQPSVTDDIYSVGATIYDLLAGKPPFYSGDIITQVREKPPVSMAEHRIRLRIEGKEKIPPHWEAAIAACLAKEPAQRPQSAKELAKLLFEPPPAITLGKISIPTVSMPKMPAFKLPEMPKLPALPKLPAIPPVPREKLIAAAVVSVVIIAAVIGAIAYSHRPKPVPPKPIAQATPVPAPSAVATPIPAPVIAAASVAPVQPAASPTPAPLAPRDIEAMDSTKLLALAQSGNPIAEGLAGLWYSAGYKVPQDYKQGFQWAKKASDAGDPVGQFALALYYWTGDGVAQDKDSANTLAGKAVPKLMPMSLANEYTAAGYCMGRAYEEGIGIGQSQVMALSLFEKQAGQGNAMAQYEAGLMYANGDGTAADIDKAAQMFQSAANQQLPDAILAMALMYQSGKGLPQDQDKSVDQWQQAADAGSIAAQESLGRMYAQGSGVTKDLQKASELFQKAANQGSAAALYSLGWMCATGQGFAKDTQKATGYYQDAADLGFAPANAALALLYAAGTGVSADAAKASDLYQKATTAGESSNVLSDVAPRLSTLLASSSDSQTPNLDPVLVGEWQASGSAGTSSSGKVLWQMGKDGQYTLSGSQDDNGTADGSEGFVRLTPASGNPVDMAYSAQTSSLETYGPDGLVKWRRVTAGRSSSGSSKEPSSGGGIKQKLKHIFTFGHS